MSKFDQMNMQLKKNSNQYMKEIQKSNTQNLCMELQSKEEKSDLNTNYPNLDYIKELNKESR